MVGDSESAPEAHIQSIAARVVWGPVEGALDDAREHEEIPRLVSRAVAEMLLAQAVGRQGVGREVHVWPTAQRGARALAALPGAQGKVLAHALFDACVREPIDGPPVGLEQESLEWLLQEIPERIEWLIDYPGVLMDADERSPIMQERFLFSALFDLGGEQGARLMLRMVAHHDTELKSTYVDMRAGKRAAWPPETWVLRLNALSDAKIDPRPSLLDVFGIGLDLPPVESAPAQVRLACVYGREPTDPLVRAVGERLAGYCGGVPEEDVRLFDWGAAPEHRDLLRQILEMAGPSGYRECLVGAALDTGLVDRSIADDLGGPLERGAWIDGPIPWSVAEVLEAGVLRTRSGTVGGADPFWAGEGLPWTLDVPAGDHPVRVVTAVHPLSGTANAAVELVIDRSAEVRSWRPIPGAGGYIPEGTFSLADADLLTDIPFELIDPSDNHDLERVFGRAAAHVELDAGDRGTVVVFSVGRQHPTCPSWAGYDPDGQVVRVLTSLGLLELDPVDRPLPWGDGG